MNRLYHMYGNIHHAIIFCCILQEQRMSCSVSPPIRVLASVLYKRGQVSTEGQKEMKKYCFDIYLLSRDSAH